MIRILQSSAPTAAMGIINEMEMLRKNIEKTQRNM